MKIFGIFGIVIGSFALGSFVIFDFSNTVVETITRDTCKESGYYGGYMTWNFHRYCTKLYSSVYESPYVPYKQAIEHPELAKDK